MKRRTFVKTLPAATILAGTASTYPLKAAVYGNLQPINLPPPEKDGGKSVLAALQERKTTRSCMEDLIYILLGLAWLFFTFYTQYRKKKQRELQSSKSTDSEHTPQKKSLLEELFSENEMFQERKDTPFPSLDYDTVESHNEEQDF